MKRHFAFFLWLFLLVFSFYWFSLSPTIKPADIELTGIIKPARLSENPKDTDEGYIVELEIGK